MINEQDLVALLWKYDINPDKMGIKFDRLIEMGNPSDIEYMLSYLRHDLGVPPRRIEKCPSILYCGLDNIEDNYKFLVENNFDVLRGSDCLHILSTDHEQLIETFNYVVSNYGFDYLYDIPSILRLPVSRIEEVEIASNGNLSKYGILSVCVNATAMNDKDERNSYNKKIDELRSVIDTCNRYGIKYKDGGMIFRKSSDEIVEIINTCRKYGIDYRDGGIIFLSTPSDIEKIVEISLAHGIDYKDGGLLFSKSPDKILEIIMACLECDVSLNSGTVFESSPKDI